MSLFISRFSNLSARRLASARFFSSSPCCILSDKILGESSDGGKIVNYRVFDPSTEQVVTSCKKKFPKKLLGQTCVGASQGWVASMEFKDLPVLNTCEVEAFCLTASMYPGLKPNSIYYIGHGLCSYDLASGTVHSFNPPRVPMLNYVPFWIPSHL
ncbi:unnamed protein product [Arabidopsis lyrata]|uniref:Uncharacterized protein n=1 Tax=Arabidopsis lyrata subsp. lyrata TaxID=81972 RepID=D7MKU2_ARALL|nr:hypothetical protein ARALYDRAFT_920009 [Arabidopsis lyrata subsp. lyrata]CAH8281029.1 unnamed protein product [Arabidopsis lyrata]